ncbi:hypothetical protein CLV58_101200 [Spirosoma oryzae]|uniref:Uncharacterized protein n=2 Tax=Spirosoma oryzae TaxID=1469603 RepID=A0A2T0TN31_9BACT|nr:hypothetical protein CLV58_101200 [Spirosoma oryzae]
MLTDAARGIDTVEGEGIMETSHFIINYVHARKRPLLAFEFNVQGGRIGDLLNYIIKVGNDHDLIRDGRYIPIGRGSVESILERIRRCSEIEIKVHKDDIHRVKQLDEDTFAALDKLATSFQSEYVAVDLKYDYRQRDDTREGNNIVERIVNGLLGRPDLASAFKKLTVTAEDSERGNLLDTFDLLVDKQKSKLKVQLVEGHAVVVSDDIFHQIEKEIIKKRLLD